MKLILSKHTWEHRLCMGCKNRPDCMATKTVCVQRRAAEELRVQETGCTYNAMVDCPARNNCDKCGWNSDVSEKRREVLRALAEKGALRKREEDE